MMKYRTFSQLLADVSNDFRVYGVEGLIDPSQLIKVAQRVNYDLGLKIHTTKEKILDITNGKARLPEDFYVLNFALLCNKFTVKERVDYGTVREDVVLDPECCKRCGQPDPTCSCEKTYTVCDDVHIKVVQRISYQTREYTDFTKIRIRPSRHVDSSCMNTTFRCNAQGEIKNGYLYTNVSTGKIYISYEGSMEDGDELMVLDHPEINHYYETALKEKILENLYYDGEDVERKWKYMQEEKKKARKAALVITDTPDFAEMEKIWKLNRAAMYQKYYSMFESR